MQPHDSIPYNPDIANVFYRAGYIETWDRGFKRFVMNAYKNLIPGKTYEVSGTLMQKDTGKEAMDDSGKPITAKSQFTPERPDGTTDITFIFSGAKLAGKSVVAFEALYENEVEVAKYEDRNDESQIVSVLSLKTLATFKAGGKRALSYEQQVVTDKITYNCLVPGTYMIRTALMKKADGTPVTSNGRPVTASATVELKEMTGTVSVDITIPPGTLLGDAVVFEEFVMIGKDGRKVVVGEHKDLKDAVQTVSLYTDKTTTNRTTPPARTCDESNSMMWILIGAAALAAIIISVVLLKNRRKNNNR